MRYTKIIGVLMLALASLSASKNEPQSYVERLKAFKGTSYLTLDCQKYIEAAAEAHGHCGAKGMWNGCNNQAIVIAEFQTKDWINASTLVPGDVLDFHGIHVVAYVGEGKFMDSDAANGGVNYRNLKTVNSHDIWFRGPVRVVRWKTND